MKLVHSSPSAWQYEFNPNEADLLLGLVRKFPFTELDRAGISRTDREAKMVEREKLLNESLVEHRKHLQRLALNLLADEKWKNSEAGRVLTLEPEARETLLQILNDIRIGGWRALGEPEDLDAVPERTSLKEFACRHLMEIAGYFEMGLLEQEDAE